MNTTFFWSMDTQPQEFEVNDAIPDLPTNVNCEILKEGQRIEVVIVTPQSDYELESCIVVKVIISLTFSTSMGGVMEQSVYIIPGVE